MLNTDKFNKIKQIAQDQNTFEHSDTILKMFQNTNELKESHNQYALKDLDEYKEIIIENIAKEHNIPDYFSSEIKVTIPKEYEISSIFQKFCYVESINNEKITVPVTYNPLENKFYTLHNLQEKLNKIHLKVLIPIIGDISITHDELDYSPKEDVQGITGWEQKEITIDEYGDPWESWGKILDNEREIASQSITIER